MAEFENSQLDDFYGFIRNRATLRSTNHAREWARGTLEMLGTILDRGTKRAVSKNLPADLARSLNGIFWLAYFRNSNYPAEEFCQRVARRSGNSDSEFARIPVKAVFAGLQLYLGPDLDQRVSKSLPPEIQQMWQESQLESVGTTI